MYLVIKSLKTVFFYAILIKNVKGAWTMLSKRYAYVEKDRCVSCGACAKECPKSAISIWRGCFAVVMEEICIGCGKCTRVCPAGCISLEERG